ncbi:MAG: hypothetical protein XD72_1432 [Methanothrix harundinacea]|jgi:hypothetical protein|uniref:Uncharacterized protein n=1 Tax=Methanothrix harundinacea TaxID=301375 RepID=A0A101FTE8_9EURY|nr:MAG: hypothetical protein XD72_1432 [Methanothrix harundinacea]KUK96974.1 MAG: hypothetical protein XE07_0746 [Methanothrix harundinacea]
MMSTLMAFAISIRDKFLTIPRVSHERGEVLTEI